MKFSPHGYWSELLFPPPGDLPDPGTDPTSLKSPALVGGFFIINATFVSLGRFIPSYFDLFDVMVNGIVS